MKVGVPKEIKTHEYRVGLTPAAVREFTIRGHQVLVQTMAGDGMGSDDDSYRRAGAVIVLDVESLFEEADLIIKVKEPQPSELALLRAHHILFTFPHLAPDPAQAFGLCGSGCTAIAYEPVRENNGSLPLLAPMSEVAGRLSMTVAGNALMRSSRGCGLLLGGVPGVAPARVLVLGAGVAGTHAIQTALGAGADPTYEVDGIIHYCVANMPGAVPLTSSHALNHATLPFGLALAERGLAAAQDDPRLQAGLNVFGGHLTHAQVANSLGMPYVAPLQTLGRRVSTS